MAYHSYTPSEKAKRARLVIKGVKNAYGDTSKVEREIDTIDRRAADRWEREQQALERQIDDARNQVAMAKARLKAATSGDRGTARQQLKDAERALTRAERAAR